MFWRKKPNSAIPGAIRVEFFDESTGKCFAQSDMPLERLPQSFEAATTMHRPDQDWTVLRADPMTSAEFSRTGKLKLWVRRVEKISMIDPHDILFSLPTLSNELPEIVPGSTKLEKRVVELHEDDWRQVELVSRSLQPQIDQELESIERIYNEQRVESGFKSVHVRKLIPAPLAKPIPMSELRRMCGPQATWIDGIAFIGVAGRVAGGFAVKLFSSIEFYGLCKDEMVQVLAIQNTLMNNAGAQDMAAIQDFCSRNKLVLLDWCRCLLVEPASEEFEGVFRGNVDGRAG